METLATLCRRERTIATLRWAGVVFGLVQVSLYQAPSIALTEETATARPLAFGLVLVLAAVGLAVEVALRTVTSEPAMRRVGVAVLAADLAVCLGLVAVFAFDPVSSQWALLALPVLEGALRLQLVGAVAVWAVSVPGYLARDLYAVRGFGLRYQLDATTYRLGLLLVIALFAGVTTRDLHRQRRLLSRLNEAVREVAAQQDPEAILATLCRESVRVLGVTDAEVRDGEGDLLDGPKWLPADTDGVCLAVPLRRGAARTSRVLVVTDGKRPDPMLLEAATALAESAAVALATTELLAAEQLGNRRLRSLESLRTRFVATIAHDLRLPLTVFKGVAQLLRSHRDDVSPAQVDGMLERVERQSNRLSRLADDLLDAARLDADGITLHREPCDVGRVVAATVPDLEADVEVDLAGDLVVVADAARLERVVWNLLSNAEKYGRPPVTLRARVDDGTLRLVVRDCGRGLSAAQRERLFSDFASSEDARSVGLGLSIVAQLVGAHGGTVEYADAEPGAQFTVTLPPVELPAVVGSH